VARPWARSGSSRLLALTIILLVSYALMEGGLYCCSSGSASGMLGAPVPTPSTGEQLETSTSTEPEELRDAMADGHPSEAESA
jgi:hypothetical protein